MSEASEPRKPLVLVTRPAPMGPATAAALREMGCEPIVSPLFDIHVRLDAKIDLDGVQGLVFTSRNGVRAFAEKSARRDLPVWCVGNATARLAREAGFETVHAGAGDGVALAALLVEKVAPGRGALLHPSGAELAVDLAEELRPHDIELRRVIVYDAVPRDALSEEAAAALAAGTMDAVLLYSPRAAARFAGLAAGAALAPDRTLALCLSEAVARPVATLPWRRVVTAGEPNETALLAGFQRALAEPGTAATEPDMSDNPAEQNERPTPAASATATPAADADAKSAGGKSTGAKSAGAKTTDAGPVTPPRRGVMARMFGWLVSLIVMIAIAAAAVLSAPHWRPLALEWLPPELAGQLDDRGQPRVDALETALDEMRDRLTASEQALAQAQQELRTVAERAENDPGPDTAAGPGPDPGLAEDVAAMRERLDGLERTLGDLFALVADLPADGAEGASVGALVELRDRIGELETAIGALGDDAQLVADIEALRAAISDLRQSLADAAGADATARGELAARLDETAARLDGIAALEARLAESNAQIAALERQLAERAEKRGAADARFEELSRQVAGLGEAIGALQAAAGGLTDLDARLAGLRQGLDDTAAANAELAARLDALDARTGNIARAGQQAALALQLGQLQAAVARGSPFAREIGAVKRLAAGEQNAIVEALAPLAGHAETGIDSRQRLNQRFAGLVPDILNAPQPDADDGWLAAASRVLGGLVTVRRVETDPAAGGVDAILARAEAALARGDLAAALTALDELPAAEAAIAAPWMNAARTRLAAETALDDAAAALVADLAGER